MCVGRGEQRRGLSERSGEWRWGIGLSRSMDEAEPRLSHGWRCVGVSIPSSLGLATDSDNCAAHESWINAEAVLSDDSASTMGEWDDMRLHHGRWRATGCEELDRIRSTWTADFHFQFSFFICHLEELEAADWKPSSQTLSPRP